MFEFDPAKSEANKAKHGIDFEHAQRIWLDDRLLTIEAQMPEGDERRWLAIGALDGKHWSAIFTVRDANIRLISVRRSRPDEVKLYEQ